MNGTFFCEKTGLIKEIRAYYAAPADKAVEINQLQDFDYKGRGYHLSHDDRPGADWRKSAQKGC